jgi:hypothetical protein
MQRVQATVDELKDVISLTLELVDCAFVVYSDGQLNLSDIGAIWNVIEKVGPAVVGVGQIPNELKDLTKEECDELIQFIMGELADITTERASTILEATLKAFKTCYEVYLAVEATAHANS